MGTVKDLRDLINVSRLTYRESDTEEDYNDFHNQNYHFHPPSSSTSSASASAVAINSSPYSSSAAKRLLNAADVLGRRAPTKTNKQPFISAASSSAVVSSSSSATVKAVKTNLAAASLLLLDRSKVPEVAMMTKSIDLYGSKKKLPPLMAASFSNYKKHHVIEPLQMRQNENGENNNDDARDDLISRVSKEDLKLNLTQLNDQQQPESDVVSVEQHLNDGNYDHILTYVDASVVTEWLNRSNRHLKKMYKWHQSSPSKNNNNKAKHESFILFASFWLGSASSSAAAASSSSSSSSTNENHLTDKQRRQLIEMEYSIIQDEVIQAFQVGLESQAIQLNDVFKLLRAVFKEYPMKLLSFRGNYLLLDYIDLLSSDRNDPNYKRLLSDVKCRTMNKQYAQWLLSIRSFALINMCWSIVKFSLKTVNLNMNTTRNNDQNKKFSENSRAVVTSARLIELDSRLSNLSVSTNSKMSKKEALKKSTKKAADAAAAERTNDSGTDLSSSSSSTAEESNEDDEENETESTETDFDVLPSTKRYDLYLESVYKNDLPDVLHYLLVTDKVSLFRKDDQNRNLLFLAVMQDKPKILNYLVKRWPCIDINEPCDNGNTALHAAVNKGSKTLVEILLKSLDNNGDESANAASSVSASSTATMMTSRRRAFHRLDVNKQNEKCMNATPLHLAIWNEHEEIALLLLRAGADPHLKMNGISDAFDMAKDNESSNGLLLEILNDFRRTNSKDKNNNNNKNQKDDNEA